MKKLILILLITLSSSSVIACGDYLLHLLDDKQFADDDTIYDPDNSQHRGWRQYLAKSLYHTRNIVLTFDDGPHPVNTPRLLDLLKKYNVKATFFTVTDRVKLYPQIAKRIVEEGHILASHSTEHLNSNGQSETQYYNDLKESLLIVKNLYHKNESYYRFPYGAYGRGKGGYHHLNVMKKVGQDLYGENCINFTFWDIDTSDWVSEMKPQDIVQTVKSYMDGGQAWRFVKRNGKYHKEAFQVTNPEEGGVILMHDIHKRTVDAMELLLPKLRDWGVQVKELKSVDEYFYGAKTCELISGIASL